MTRSDGSVVPTMTVFDTPRCRTYLQTGQLPNGALLSMQADIYEDNTDLKFVVTSWNGSLFSLYGWKFRISRYTYKLTTSLTNWTFNINNNNPVITINCPLLFRFVAAVLSETPPTFRTSENSPLNVTFFPGVALNMLPQGINFKTIS